jgi:hypothetical protein
MARYLHAIRESIVIRGILSRVEFSHGTSALVQLNVRISEKGSDPNSASLTEW